MQPADRFVPHYYRLESHLRESIRSGALKPGDPIPPESHLSQKFGVSRTTVRQALSRLVYEGLITRQRGRGSFVTEPPLEHTLPFMSFEEEMQARGAKAAVKFLDMRTEPAQGKVAAALRLPEGTAVTILERQRLVDGQIVGYEIRYFPRDIGEALTTEEIHTQPMVVAVRRIVGRARTRLVLRVTASTARRTEARILGAKAGAPVLVRENTWYVDPDRVVQYGKSIYRGDRFQMVVEYSASPMATTRVS